jgi:hypothetical protein
VSKVLKNNTASPISIADTGVTIPASSSYTIPYQDYLLWAASSNIITQVGSGNVIVNDGSSDLSISDGTDWIKGIFSKKIIGGTDGTPIGNLTDRLKVYDADTLTILNSIAISLGASTGGVYKYESQPVTTRTETDLSTTTYTVPTGKKFSINNFTGNYDLQFTTIVRFKKQTGGVGAWETLFSLTLQVGGQGQSTVPINFGNGVIIGTATDKFKITYECSNSRGTVRGFFTGNEI